jgi:hypothetical protein
MAQRFPSPAGRRRRGNPNWGRAGGRIPEIPTEFEEQVRHLGLTRQTCSSSLELRRWCERNKDRCYIPEWLLKLWGIAVNEDLSGAA